MYYTSILPPDAVEIKQPKLKWGDVLYCIMARNDGKKGRRICAGVLIVKIIAPNGDFLGSLAIEYTGNEKKNESLNKLMKVVPDMIERRGFGILAYDGLTSLGYKIIFDEFIYESKLVTKKYGTVLASICFKGN